MTLSRRNEHPRQALLIGAPHQGNISMHNDVTAMHAALQARGLGPEEILSLEGMLDRRILITFLEGVGRRMAQWRAGELFLYFGGHGFFTGETVDEARVGVQLQDAAAGANGQHVYWEEIFVALSIPTAVTFTMLIDH
ncbi:MAG: hypothetical protein MI924_13195 [Chloroflexales bacterium]|nr:hypothetical protein [Chloroflexales bacterium]